MPVLDLRISDTDLQASNNNGSGGSSIELPPRPQRAQRIDYHFLNGGSDDDDIEDHTRTKPRLDRHSVA
jgi:hypothetical protein